MTEARMSRTAPRVRLAMEVASRPRASDRVSRGIKIELLLYSTGTGYRVLLESIIRSHFYQPGGARPHPGHTQY